tara:strand:- start:2065 stop:2556 length:492 start_codon:yes stop_codon:yes gene_type:complete
MNTAFEFHDFFDNIILMKHRRKKLAPLNCTEAEFKRIEEAISSMKDDINHRFKLLEETIKNDHTKLPPLSSNLQNTNFHDTLPEQVECSTSMSLRDSLMIKPHYVPYPKRKFVSANNSTFVSLGTWSDKKSKEFDFRSILENESHKYKRYPKLSNDKRPLWKG